MPNITPHVKDSGIESKTIPLKFLRKVSGSISGPFADVIKPDHIPFRDYEVKIILVICRELRFGTTVTAVNSCDCVAGLTVTKDMPALDIQLIKTHFYEDKSYPTFNPMGPALVLLDGDEQRPAAAVASQRPNTPRHDLFIAARSSLGFSTSNTEIWC